MLLCCGASLSIRTLLTYQWCLFKNRDNFILSDAAYFSIHTTFFLSDAGF